MADSKDLASLRTALQNDIDALIRSPKADSAGMYDDLIREIAGSIREALEKGVRLRKIYEAFTAQGGKLAFKTFSRKVTELVYDGKRRRKKKR